MVDFKDIRKSAKYSDRWLRNKQAKHIAMIEKSIQKLQNDIVDLLAKLAVNPNGRIEGLKVNLKQAQAIHKQIIILFKDDFSEKTKKIIDDFDSVQKSIETSFGYLDEAVKFTTIDKKAMAVLKDGYYQNYLALGATQQTKVVQAIYDQVLANAPFSQLVNTIEGALIGKKGVTGTPLSVYAKTYANDFIMNFHNEVQLAKAQTAGLTHFLYVGNVIEDSRPFCIARAGNYYTIAQINSWTFPWQGKSGPAMTHRGGYNCRHHWQPIKPDWLGDAGKVEVQNWFTENQ